MNKDKKENAENSGAGSTWRMKISRSRVITTLILTVVAAACMLILIMPEANRKEYRTGDVVGEPVYATVDFLVNDASQMEKLREQAERKVPHYFRLDAQKLADGLARLDSLKAELRHRIKLEDAGNAYQAKERTSVPDDVVKIVSSLSPEAFRIVRRANGRLDACFEAWKDMLRAGIRPADFGGEKFDLSGSVRIFSPGGDGGAWSRLEPVELGRLMRHEDAVSNAVDDLCTPFPAENPESGKQMTEKEIRAEFTKQFESVILNADLVYDAEKTRLERELARNSAAPVYRGIKAGQLLVPAGGKITQETADAISHGYCNLKSGNDQPVWTMIRKLWLILGLMFFICIYIYHIHPEVARNNGSIWLLSGITVFSLFSDWAFVFFTKKWNLPVPNDLMFMTLPLAMPVLLVSVIYGLRSGIYVGLFSSGIAAVALGNSFPAFISGLLVSGIAGFAVRYTMDYKKFFIRSLLACTITVFFSGIIFVGSSLFREYGTPSGGDTVRNAGVETAADAPAEAESFHVFEGKSLKLSDEAMHRIHSISVALVALPLANGAATAIVTLLALFLLESFFGVASNMSYLSFTDRNHALLRELQQNAPGTYQHSERVASLAEKAALTIGLNPMKVQACALFHDVGKLKYPGMFIENSEGVNPHDGLTPQESVDFIRQHVSYGLEEAKKYKLLPLIRRAIERHHGTDFISFFYDKAKKNGQTDLKESDFRYAGPLPCEREVVIVALADCTEAAVKSLSNPTPEAIRDMVCTLFERKLHSGQLDDAALTVHELAQIREAFIQSLIQMNHRRIPYPDNQKEPEKI